jgi:hypothetical protein
LFRPAGAGRIFPLGLGGETHSDEFTVVTGMFPLDVLDRIVGVFEKTGIVTGDAQESALCHLGLTIQKAWGTQT